MDFRLTPVNPRTHKRKNRNWARIIDEGISILLKKQLTVTNFKTELNVSYPIIKRVIKELEDRELVETLEKESRSYKLCTYYYIPWSKKVILPLNRLRQ